MKTEKKKSREKEEKVLVPSTNTEIIEFTERCVEKSKEVIEQGGEEITLKMLKEFDDEIEEKREHIIALGDSSVDVWTWAFAGLTAAVLLNVFDGSIVYPTEEKSLILEHQGIKADLTWCGRSGSPTKVHRIQSVVLTGTEHKRVEPNTQAIEEMVHELIEDHTIG